MDYKIYKKLNLGIKKPDDQGNYYNNGAGDKDRTYDLCVTSALLYQLSYPSN